MQNLKRAGLFKRIAAMVYDLLAVIALAMLATIINLLMVSYGADFGLFDLTGYADPSSYLNDQVWFQIELLLWCWLFYAWFWYDGGQTIGMRAWRMKVQRIDGRPLEFKRAALRAAVSLLGLGNLFIIFNPRQKLALQDKIAKTEVIILSKEENKQVYLRGIEAPNEE